MEQLMIPKNEVLRRKTEGAAEAPSPSSRTPFINKLPTDSKAASNPLL